MENYGGKMNTYCIQIEKILNTLRRVDVSDIFDADVTTPEFLMLQLVDRISQESGTRGVWVSELVAQLPVTAQAVSKLLRSIENKGCINRITNAAYRRRTEVRMTEAGKELYMRLAMKYAKLMDRVYADFEDDEYGEFLRLTEKFVNSYAKGIKSLAVEK